jgi:hypothetical protein
MLYFIFFNLQFYSKTLRLRFLTERLYLHKDAATRPDGDNTADDAAYTEHDALHTVLNARYTLF